MRWNGLKAPYPRRRRFIWLVLFDGASGESAANRGRSIRPPFRLTAGGSSLYGRSGGFRLDAAIFDRGPETSHHALAEIEFVVIRNETRHLRVNELFAEQLIGRHRGEGPKLLWGKL